MTYHLFMVIYAAAGAVGGVVGPLPGPEGWATCQSYVIDARQKMAARPDLPQLRFECECHAKRPQLTERL